MKKFICFFTCCISFFIFYLIFSLYSTDEMTRLSSPTQMMRQYTAYHSYIYEMDFQGGVEKAIYTLQEYAKTYDAVIAIGTDVEDEGLFHASAWFYEDPSHILSTSISTKNGIGFTFSDETTGYISSKEDAQAIDQIDFVDQRNSASYQDMIRLYPLHMYTVLADTINIRYVYIFTKLDSQAQRSSIVNSEVQQYVMQEVDINAFEEEDSQQYMVFLHVMLVCGIAITILYSCDLYRRRKEIMIRKLMGMPTIRIMKEMFMKQFLVYIGIYTLMQVICYIIIIGSLREVVYPFIVQLVYGLLLYVCVQFIVCGCIYIYIYMSHTWLLIKQQAMTKKLMMIHYIIKIIVICTFLPSLITSLLEGETIIQEYMYMKQHEEAMRNQLYVVTVDIENAQLNPSEVMLKINTYLEEHGAMYQDFDESYAWQEIAEEGEERNAYIIVNQAYISSYELRDVDGNLIDLNTIEETTLFLPEGVALLQDASTYCYEACEVIPIQSGIRYWNHQIDASVRSLKDPLIVFQPNVITELSGNSGYHLVLTDERVETNFQSFLQEEQLSQLVSYQYTSDDYDIVMEAYKDKICYILPLLAVYLSVILVFIYQMVYMYFEQCKQQFVIQYMIGTSFFQRHGQMLYRTIVSYICILVGVYIFSTLSLATIVITIIICILLEGIAQYVLIHRIEKQKMVETLKGE